MGQPTVASEGVTTAVTVTRSMNEHGGMTVELEGTNETRHLVAYASDRVRRVLGSLPEGTTLPVRMTRVGARANVWRAEALAGLPERAAPGAPREPGSN